MPPTSIAPWPVLAQPMRGTPIEALQHLLRHHGASIAADGIFGPQTDAAVRAFQQSHGLVVDGKAGPKTFAAIIVTVRRGDQGEAVRGAQCLCVDVTVDGIFGPKTEAGVKQMQGFFGLATDGIVGPLTWRALVSNGD
jgi:peptidoglycan hydrolase-like protein with peptidoglycan-binding domain